jgi:hypothetical protein
VNANLILDLIESLLELFRVGIVMLFGFQGSLEEHDDLLRHDYGVRQIVQHDAFEEVDHGDTYFHVLFLVDDDIQVLLVVFVTDGQRVVLVEVDLVVSNTVRVETKVEALVLKRLFRQLRIFSVNVVQKEVEVPLEVCQSNVVVDFAVDNQLHHLSAVENDVIEERCEDVGKHLFVAKAVDRREQLILAINALADVTIAFRFLGALCGRIDEEIFAQHFQAIALFGFEEGEIHEQEASGWFSLFDFLSLSISMTPALP